VTAKRRGWTLVFIPESESNVRQVRLSRRTVILLASSVVLVVLYAVVETVLFWTVAQRAAEVEPLRKTVRELESSSTELAHVGQELVELRAFQQRIRRILASQGINEEEHALRVAIGDSAGAGSTDEAAEGRPFPGNPVVEARALRGVNYTAMDIPNSPPVRGYITRSFTAAVTGDKPAHYGVDIAAKQGSPVLAAADGLVLFADWTYRYGNLVLISHRSGYISIYGHNQLIFVRPGDRVRQGEPIALVGSSGQSTAPHLHFEIWEDGSPVDPARLMQSIP
jgi:murein DD-endopeptidase MepM/ murein hydrolase activator NlpD